MTQAKLAIALAALALGSCAACSATSSAASGPAVLTGVATPCVGSATPGQYAQIRVRVTVSADSHTVASQTVTGSRKYRFELSPGQYRVSSDQQYGAPRNVTLHAGHTTTVNLVTNCK